MEITPARAVTGRFSARVIALTVASVFMFTRPIASQTGAKHLVEEGEALVSRNRVLEAQKLFEQALVLQPRDLSALRDRSLLALLTGDDSVAWRRSSELLVLSPTDQQGLLIQVLALINQGNAERVLQLLSTPARRSMVLRDPILAAALNTSLDECSSRLHCEHLHGWSVKIKTDRPEWPDLSFAAQAFRSTGLRRQELAWLLEALGDPNLSENERRQALYSAAREQADLGDNEASERMLSEVLAIEPCRLDARLDASVLERKIGRTADADRNLYLAERCPSTDSAMELRLAETFMGLHMYVDASRVLAQTERVNVNDETILYDEAVCEFKIGQSDSAEAAFRRELGRWPTSVRARVGLAVVLLATNRLTEGKGILEKLVLDGTATAEALYYLANQERAGGNLERAEALLKRAVQLAPVNAQPYAALGRLHLQEDRLVEAEKDLRKSLSLDASLSVAHYSLAAVLRKQGRTEAATEETKRFLACHDEERTRGIVGLQLGEAWDYPGFLPAGKEPSTPN